MDTLKDVLMVLGIGAGLYVAYVLGFMIYGILRLMIKGDE